MYPAIDIDEQQIIQKAVKGNQAALGAIYEQHADAVYRYMLYRTGDHHIAEDITAEVFADMITAIRSYRDMGVPFRAWLFRIARARLVDHWRKMQRRVEQRITFSEDVEEFLLGDSLEDRHAYDDLLEALQYLTPAEREIILLRYAADMDNDDIATAVQSNANAVKSMMYRALKKLRTILHNKAKTLEGGTNDEATE